LAAWRKTGGEAPLAAYLAGPGSALSGAEAYLCAELGMPVTPLPALRLEGATPDRASELNRFARAIGLALGLTARPRSMNLRQGVLAYERGFGFLREKIPLLAGIGALVLTSFAFSAWMEFRAIDRQTEVLEEALAAVSLDVIGEAIRDPKMAEDAVSVTASKMDDPMPHVDGFDLMVEISKAVPTEVTHDIEEFDFQKGKATIHGIVKTIPEAQQIATAMQTVRCLENVKIVRTTKVVNEDRQKYVLELDIKCPLPGEEESTEKGEGTPGNGNAPTNEVGASPADNTEDEE
jgi:general secretion pathway protein L